MFAAAATEAFAQDSSRVLNTQLSLGDVIAGQTLNVEGASDEVAADTAAQGNSLSGATEDVGLDLSSSQTSRGNVRSSTTVNLNGDIEGPVNVTTQSRGNYVAAGAYSGGLVIESDQDTGPSEITAGTTIAAPAARMLGGASVSSTAVANTASIGGSGGDVSGTVIQRSSAGVRAETFAAMRYVPETGEFIATVIGNSAAANSSTSGQFLTVRQRQAGDSVTAATSANAANAWDLAGRARANGNQTLLYNQGGAVVATTDQSNLSRIRSSAVVTSYDFGAATAYAAGAGNEASIGNGGDYVYIDNAQVNSGGVEVTAEFDGTNGYDTRVSSDAVGNSVTGYACSACQATLEATNNQTNSGAVSALSTTTIRGEGRSAASSARAVGNTATFYVSRPGT